MINHIEGRLIEKTPTHAVIDCNGVGYVMQISLNTYSKIGDPEGPGEKCKLFTDQLYIRDDMPRFYGFADVAERNLFRQLVSVSGVGGTSALLMLSSLSAQEIQQAIVSGNVVLLKSVKGIGEKTAQRIIIDLKGKLGDISGLPSNFLSAHNTIKEEALIALVNLGFAKQTAEKAIEKVIQADPSEKTVEVLIKDTLKNL